MGSGEECPSVRVEGGRCGMVTVEEGGSDNGREMRDGNS